MFVICSTFNKKVLKQTKAKFNLSLLLCLNVLQCYIIEKILSFYFNNKKL